MRQKPFIRKQQQNNPYLVHLLLGLVLSLSFNSVLAGSTAANQYKYKVEFNHPEANTDKSRSDHINIKNSELKILLFGKDHAIIIDTNEINNTKIQYQQSSTSLQNNIKKLETRGAKYIICEGPSINTEARKGRVYSTNIKQMKVQNEINRLRQLGYHCGTQ